MASKSDIASTPETAPISGLVPMIHVADVERSAGFYRLLGFEIGNHVPPAGRMHWAWLYAPKADNWKRGPNLMLTRSARPIDASAQHVLFYLYAADLKSLRSSLVAKDVKASEISYPDYLPEGEFRVQDPDGYTLMIAQSAADTP
jgi:catechol 2,3-dioxygenase-like lactoylglutathione lyase family enzyme